MCLKRVNFKIEKSCILANDFFQIPIFDQIGALFFALHKHCDQK